VLIVHSFLPVTVVPAQAGIHTESPKLQTMRLRCRRMGPRFREDDVQTGWGFYNRI
jgi:hypothetical protein